MKGFKEVYNLELFPLRQNLNKSVKNQKSNKYWFNHFSLCYIKYLHIYRNMEDCFENSNNPQKKQILKDMLDNLIKRILKVKNYLVKLNTHTKAINSDFINFD